MATKIAAPRHQEGKIILQYKGSNLEKRNKPSSIIKCKLRIREIKLVNNLNRYENLVLQFRLFDDAEAILLFKSNDIYWKSNIADEIFGPNADWKILEYEILIDKENIFFIGEFTVSKNNNLGEARLEEYSYIAIFERRDQNLIFNELLDLKSIDNLKISAVAE